MITSGISKNYLLFWFKFQYIQMTISFYNLLLFVAHINGLKSFLGLSLSSLLWASFNFEVFWIMSWVNGI